MMASSLRDQFVAFVANFRADNPVSEQPQPYDLGSQDTYRPSWLGEKRPLYRAAIEFPTNQYHRYWLFHDFKQHKVPPKVEALIGSLQQETAASSDQNHSTRDVLTRGSPFVQHTRSQSPYSPPAHLTQSPLFASRENTPLEGPPADTQAFAIGESCPGFDGFTQLDDEVFLRTSPAPTPAHILQSPLPPSDLSPPPRNGRQLRTRLVTTSVQEMLDSRKRAASQESISDRLAKRASVHSSQYTPLFRPPLTAAERAALPRDMEAFLNDDGVLDSKKLRSRPRGGVPCYYTDCDTKFNTFATAACHIMNKMDSEQKWKALGFAMKKDLQPLSQECGVLNEAPAICTFQGVISETCNHFDWDTIMTPKDEPATTESATKRKRAPPKEPKKAYCATPKRARPPRPAAAAVSNPKKALHAANTARAIRLKRVTSIDFIRHQLAGTAGLPCCCGLVFGSIYHAVIHDRLGCKGSPLTMLEWLNSLPSCLSMYNRLFHPQIYAASDIRATDGYEIDGTGETSETGAVEGIDNASTSGNGDQGDADWQPLPDPETLDEPASNDRFFQTSRDSMAWTSEMSCDDEWELLLKTTPPGRLCIYPDRFSGGKIRKSDTAQWLRNARDHLNAFELQCPTLRLILVSTASWTLPLFPGTPEYSVLWEKGAITSNGERGSTTMHGTARVTCMMFDLLERREPHDRIIVMCSDSWTSSAPNLAWACAVYDFRLHVGLTDVDIDATMGVRTRAEEVRSAIKSDGERYFGYDGTRHWFEVQTRALARVYAGLEEDGLVAGFLAWCSKKQGGKRIMSNTGRGDDANSANELRVKVLERWDSMPQRVKDRLVEHGLDQAE
ncbi:hypothetical protein LTR85_001981 [Meristemomyces frigidus]|nr:hypothetical protein LTR85_001981 [Meristemomyces frigidus]